MKKKMTLCAALKRIKSLEQELADCREVNENLRRYKDELYKKLEEERKEHHKQLSEKYTTQIGQMIQSVAEMNIAVSKMVLSKDKNL